MRGLIFLCIPAIGACVTPLALYIHVVVRVVAINIRSVQLQDFSQTFQLKSIEQFSR